MRQSFNGMRCVVCALSASSTVCHRLEKTCVCVYVVCVCSWRSPHNEYLLRVASERLIRMTVTVFVWNTSNNTVDTIHFISELSAGVWISCELFYGNCSKSHKCARPNVDQQHKSWVKVERRFLLVDFIFNSAFFAASDRLIDVDWKSKIFFKSSRQLWGVLPLENLMDWIQPIRRNWIR